MRKISIVCLTASLAWPLIAGCQEVSRVTAPTWHQKCGWKAEDYFDDPQVIALCKAIEANDLAEIDRLIAAGVDVPNSNSKLIHAARKAREAGEKAAADDGNEQDE
jgi:hypothetical protein